MVGLNRTTLFIHITFDGHHPLPSMAEIRELLYGLQVIDLKPVSDSESLLYSMSDYIDCRCTDRHSRPHRSVLLSIDRPVEYAASTVNNITTRLYPVLLILAICLTWLRRRSDCWIHRSVASRTRWHLDRRTDRIGAANLNGGRWWGERETNGESISIDRSKYFHSWNEWPILQGN